MKRWSAICALLPSPAHRLMTKIRLRDTPGYKGQTFSAKRSAYQFISTVTRLDDEAQVGASSASDGSGADASIVAMISTKAEHLRLSSEQTGVEDTLKWCRPILQLRQSQAVHSNDTSGTAPAVPTSAKLGAPVPRSRNSVPASRIHMSFCSSPREMAGAPSP